MVKINKEKQLSRIIWIDWAKSICMLLVIMGHCHIDYSGQYVGQYIYSFHMMLFFFLSGYLCNRRLSWGSVIKDFHFIIVPYLVFGILGIIVGIIRTRTFILNDASFKLYQLLIGNDASIGAIWFLPAIFLCKQLFLIIKTIKPTNASVYYLFVSLSFIPAFIISHYNYNLPFFADSSLCGLPFFIVGNESFDKTRKIFKLRKNARLGAALFFLVTSVIMSNYNGFVCLADCHLGQSIVLYYLTAFCAIISILLFCSILNDVICLFVTITAYGTIVTLGTHGIFLSLFNYYFPKLIGIEPGTYSLYWAILFSTITYVGCFYLILVIDKYCPSFFGLRGDFISKIITVHT